MASDLQRHEVFLGGQYYVAAFACPNHAQSFVQTMQGLLDLDSEERVGSCPETTLALLDKQGCHDYWRSLAISGSTLHAANNGDDE